MLCTNLVCAKIYMGSRIKMDQAIAIAKRPEMDLERKRQNENAHPTVERKRSAEKQTTAAEGAHRCPQRNLYLGQCAAVDISV